MTEDRTRDFLNTSRAEDPTDLAAPAFGDLNTLKIRYKNTLIFCERFIISAYTTCVSVLNTF